MRIKFFFTSIVLALIAMVIGCKKDSYNEVIGLCPIVIMTNPLNGATGVPLTQIITADFNEPINPSTINETSFIIIGDSQIHGSISYAGVTATFTPDVPLKDSTTYTARITQTVKNLQGNALQTDYVWTFSTGATLNPLVIITDPTDLQTGVNLNKIISVTFSMPMNSSTINSNSFILKNGSAQVDGVVSFVGLTAYFTPSSPLESNTSYTGIITTTVRAESGTPLHADYTWTFSTLANVAPYVVSTDPAYNSVDVALSKSISATFSTPMDPNTINSSNFTLYIGNTAVLGTVSYSGIVARFTPSSPLIQNTTYTATLTSNVKDVNGTKLKSSYIWIFSTGSALAPTVISTDPRNNEVDVLLTKVITATFSEAMNPSTINSSNFTLKKGAITISGIVSYNGVKASFFPSSPLTPNTVYTARITNEAKNIFGTALINDYVWTFTTNSAVAPTVIATDPFNNATSIPLDKRLTATFSTAMDPLTINSNTFILRQGSNVINGTILFSGSTATFIPSSPLQSNVNYTVTVTNGAKNLQGISLVNNYIWSFTTMTIPAPNVLSTDPLRNATDVPVDKVILISFNEVMDPSTINAQSFTLKQAGLSVSGTISYTGKTAKFTPSTPLKLNTVYTASVNTRAKSISGISLASDYSWSFTTSIVPSPSVISTDPVDNAKNVVLNKVLSANFSTLMDPQTINGSSFFVKQGSNVIAGVVTYIGSTAYFTPTNSFLSNTIYTATITSSAKSLQGTTLKNNYVWSFTTLNTSPLTVVTTDPLHNASNVLLNKVISATFSTALDPTTINTSSFTVRQGASTISGTVAYSGIKATFTPNNPLSSNALYTITISNNVKSVNGIAMLNDYVWSFTTLNTQAPIVNLESVQRFGIIAGAGINNQAGISEIHDLDVGIYPGIRSSITGFPPAIVVNGDIYSADDAASSGVPSMLRQAKVDLTAAYNFAAGASSPSPITLNGDQGGKMLVPGIYKSDSSLWVEYGNLTLNAQGDPNAIWIFQIPRNLTTYGSAGGNIYLSGGAQAKNIFWQVGSSVSLGSFTSFQGNILALSSITLNSGALIKGMLLSMNGSVILTNTNIINKP